MRIGVALFWGLAIGLGCASAQAQAKNFGNRGTFAISAERLFGIYISRANVSYNYPIVRAESHANSTEVGFLWQGSSRSVPYTVPRVGLDCFVIDHLSLGGTLTFASTSVEVENGTSANGSGFLFGPRVGYATMFNNWAGIWPRGGFSYYSFSGDAAIINGLAAGDHDQFALNAEVMFILQPAEGFAILLGPSFDFGLTGRLSVQGNQHADLHEHTFGFLTAGLMGWL